MTGKYVRSHYRVPAHPGRHVVFDGAPAVITGFTGAYVLIQRDGDTEPVPAHPTWHMTYLLNGIPADQYGVWCEHDKHVHVVDVDDPGDYPGTVHAQPWPCEVCTPGEIDAAITAHCEAADEYAADAHLLATTKDGA